MASAAASSSARRAAGPGPRARRWIVRAALLGALALPVLASGCTDPCLVLAQKLCDCQPTEIAKQTCLTNMLNAFQAARSSDISSQDAVCSKLVDKCDCHKLDTPAGKQACGLAR